MIFAPTTKQLEFVWQKWPDLRPQPGDEFWPSFCEILKRLFEEVDQLKKEIKNSV